MEINFLTQKYLLSLCLAPLLPSSTTTATPPPSPKKRTIQRNVYLQVYDLFYYLFNEKYQVLFFTKTQAYGKKTWGFGGVYEEYWQF